MNSQQWNLNYPCFELKLFLSATKKDGPGNVGTCKYFQLLIDDNSNSHMNFGLERICMQAQRIWLTDKNDKKIYEDD